MNSEDELKLCEAELWRRESRDNYPLWLTLNLPKYQWDWKHLSEGILPKLQAVTEGRIDRLGIMIPPQHGKPVYIGSMVLTDTGLRKRLDEIQVGDKVITHLGRPRMVSAVHIQGDLPCVRIRTELGRETVAALTHPFLTPAGWVEAGSLKSGDVLASVPRPVTNPSQLSRPLEEFRLAGYFVGDGCTVMGKSGSCHSTITCADPVLQPDLFVAAEGSGFTLRAEAAQAKRAPGFYVGGAKEWLRAAGLSGCNSHTKRVPPWVFEGSALQIANFLGAYYDCDGCLSGRGMGRNGGVRKDPCLEFYSVNRALLEDTQHLLLRLGIRSRIARKLGRYNGNPHVSWRLTITSVDDVSRFSTVVPLKGERGERLRGFTVPRTRFDPQFIEDPIVAVEDAGSLPCRCLTVEEDHTFTSDDLVVHNTRSVSVPYPVWRMIRTPGLRAGICSHSQRYANKISRWARQLAVSAGMTVGDVGRADEWELSNGSTFLARGRGASISGESLDLLIVDDVFGSRQDADSPVVQEEAYEWYMDDVTPRLQKDAAIVLVNTRWGPGDLYGRIAQSEEAGEWDILRLPAIAEENDPLGRLPGEALCPDRYPIDKLRQKQRVEGIGFESLYQGNPVPRGGTFFERKWFGEPVSELPAGAKLVRYWDLASSRLDSACYTSGVLIASVGTGEAKRFYVVDVIRGRWMPADRNDVMLQTAIGDEQRPGFERTYFEEPVFDKGRAAMRGIMAKLAGHRVSPHNVSGAGSKELRAEPLADASKAGLVRFVAGSWNAAWLTEMESFPRGQYKDQVDSSSGGYTMLNQGELQFLT